MRDEAAFRAHRMEVAVSMHQLDNVSVSVRTLDHQQRPLHAEEALRAAQRRGFVAFDVHLHGHDTIRFAPLENDVVDPPGCDFGDQDVDLVGRLRRMPGRRSSVPQGATQSRK